MTEQVYISIGNSDNKLTQTDWSLFVERTAEIIGREHNVHGEWYSESAAPFQNACFCIDKPDDDTKLVASLKRLCARFEQDSIAYAVVSTTMFLTPGI